jgi:hypothetical protein
VSAGIAASFCHRFDSLWVIPKSAVVTDFFPRPKSGSAASSSPARRSAHNRAPREAENLPSAGEFNPACEAVARFAEQAARLARLAPIATAR